ncbi:MAG: DNA polymerase, partial [Dehalococcoidia bacterium]|nr:DNA polymerase [Dehalococcoidia bacterium]
GVLNKYGVPPSKIIDLKGLVGDPSDNIPGVKGIGEKTGLKLLERFGSINGIYEHIDQVEPDKLREKLVEGKAMAFKSRELATIDRNTPVKLDLVSSKSSGHDRNKAIALFQELEFSSLIKKLTEIGEDRPVVSLPESPTRLAGDYKTITSIPELSNITRHLAELPLVAFDVETSGKNSLQSSLVGVSLCAAAGEAFYIPVGHSTLEGINQIPWEMVAALLKPLLSGTKPQKVAHNGKFDMNVLTRYGIEFQSMDFDTMVAACLASEKSLGLKDLAFRRLGLEMTPISDLIGKGSKQVTMDTQPIDMVSAYACADADATFRLWKLLEGEIKKEGLWDLFSNVEMPLVQVLAVIERNGILVDFNILRNMSRRLGEQIAETERNIHKIAEHQFNINSPQQLSKVLFGQFDLKGKHRTKSGYSTDATVLEELRGTHDIIEEVITYRQLTKLKSTYLDALPGLINLKTGRIHTSFNQTSVATGRLSSSDPNLQNIPIKGDLGTEIRKAFVADEGWSFISADYSQIDLRVLAHLSRDPMLVTAFRQDEDIH